MTTTLLPVALSTAAIVGVWAQVGMEEDRAWLKVVLTIGLLSFPWMIRMSQVLIQHKTQITALEERVARVERQRRRQADK